MYFARHTNLGHTNCNCHHIACEQLTKNGNIYCGANKDGFMGAGAFISNMKIIQKFDDTCHKSFRNKSSLTLVIRLIDIEEICTCQTFTLEILFSIHLFIVRRFSCETRFLNLRKIEFQPKKKT